MAELIFEQGFTEKEKKKVEQLLHNYKETEEVLFMTNNLSLLVKREDDKLIVKKTNVL